MIADFNILYHGNCGDKFYVYGMNKTYTVALRYMSEYNKKVHVLGRDNTGRAWVSELDYTRSVKCVIIIYPLVDIIDSNMRDKILDLLHDDVDLASSMVKEMLDSKKNKP